MRHNASSDALRDQRWRETATEDRSKSPSAIAIERPALIDHSEQSIPRPRGPGRRWVLGAPLSLMLGSARANASTILAATPISRMDLKWWRDRHEAKLVELRAAKPNLIFLGDSITQDWEYDGPEAWRQFVPAWRRFYGDRNAVNLGFKGDTTASLLWRIRNGEVDGITPKAAVILIGANNLGRLRWSAPDTVLGIDVIIAELHRRLPTTRILLLGVLPSERSGWVTESTAIINRALAEKYAQDKTVTFQDIGYVFMKDGRLNRDLFYDPRLTPPDPPLHPTAQGQAMMAAATEPVLSGLLGDKAHQ
jgi:lysophospholipase L1-like esterase